MSTLFIIFVTFLQCIPEFCDGLLYHLLKATILGTSDSVSRKFFISHIMTPHIHDMNIYHDIATSV